MPMYRKRPVAIQARLIEADRLEELANWCGGDIAYGMGTAYGPTGINIPTLEGTMRGNINDYLIQGVQGEFYPCKAAIFDETYEEITPAC